MEKFHCRSAERPKRKAKLLKKELAAFGYDLKLQKCQNVIAMMYGFRHLSDLYDHIGLFGTSPDDESVDGACFKERFWFQSAKLMEIGVRQHVAEEIIDRVRPTSTSFKVAAKMPNQTTFQDRA